jgi:hypothetical protein
MSRRIIKFPGIQWPGIDLKGPDRGGAEAVPLALIAQAQADLRKAREAELHAPAPDPRPDFQPDVDRAVIERLYRALDRDPHR